MISATLVLLITATLPTPAPCVAKEVLVGKASFVAKALVKDVEREVLNEQITVYTDGENYQADVGDRVRLLLLKGNRAGAIDLKGKKGAFVQGVMDGDYTVDDIIGDFFRIFPLWPTAYGPVRTTEVYDVWLMILRARDDYSEEEKGPSVRQLSWKLGADVAISLVVNRDAEPHNVIYSHADSKNDCGYVLSYEYAFRPLTTPAPKDLFKTPKDCELLRIQSSKVTSWKPFADKKALTTWFDQLGSDATFGKAVKDARG